MAASIRKRRLCSYDMAEVASECYCLEDPQGAVYFCSARCLCIWSMLWATKTNLPKGRKKLDLDLITRRRQSALDGTERTGPVCV